MKLRRSQIWNIAAVLTACALHLGACAWAAYLLPLADRACTPAGSVRIVEIGAMEIMGISASPARDCDFAENRECVKKPPTATAAPPTVREKMKKPVRPERAGCQVKKRNAEKPCPAPAAVNDRTGDRPSQSPALAALSPPAVSEDAVSAGTSSGQPASPDDFAEDVPKRRVSGGAAAAGRSHPESSCDIRQDTPAGTDSPIKLTYPRISRKHGEEGDVTLRFRVLENGVSSDIVVQESSGCCRLDAAAKRAVALHRFKPAHRGALPVASVCTLTVTFRLTR